MRSTTARATRGRGGIRISQDLLIKFQTAAEAFHEVEDSIEDLLITRNPSLLRKLHTARRDHLAGRLRPIDEVGGASA